MNLLEKKKIVAEWHPRFAEVMITTTGDSPEQYQAIWDFVTKKETDLSDFRPEEDRNCWPELWDNMDSDFRKAYYNELEKFWKENRNLMSLAWFMNTVNPIDSLDVLVKTIQHSGKV